MSDFADFGGIFGGSQAAPAGVEGPLMANGDFYSQPQGPDYGKIFTAIGKVGFGVGSAFQDLGAAKQEKASGKIASQIASDESLRITNQGLKHASAVRAATGAQGTTGAGSPLISELNNIQNAQTDARTRIYQGNLEKYYANQRAKAYKNKVPADLLSGILGGASLFKTE